MLSLQAIAITKYFESLSDDEKLKVSYELFFQPRGFRFHDPTHNLMNIRDFIVMRLLFKLGYDYVSYTQMREYTSKLGDGGLALMYNSDIQLITVRPFTLPGYAYEHMHNGIVQDCGSSDNFWMIVCELMFGRSPNGAIVLGDIKVCRVPKRV